MLLVKAVFISARACRKLYRRYYFPASDAASSSTATSINLYSNRQSMVFWRQCHHRPRDLN